MASPSTTSFERPDLGQSFSEWPTSMVGAGFIGLSLVPPFSVPEKAGNFTRLPAESLLENRTTLRTPKAGYPRGEWEFEQDSWSTQEHGAEEVIDDNLKSQYRYAIDYEMVAAARARDIVLRNLENDIENELINSTTLSGNTTAATTVWSTHASAVPITDVKGVLTTFESQCGMSANVIVMSSRVFRELTQCAQIIDRLKFAGIDDPKMQNAATKRALAELFEVREVVVGGTYRNSGVKGTSVAPTFTRIWSDTTVGVFRVAETNDLQEPCIARVFAWDGDGSGLAGVFETYRDEAKRCDVMRYRIEYDYKTLYTACGHLITSVTS